ncbi:glycosyl transferase, family 2 [Magnetococcus marinus MC-1]|uniref:Glycosyl transferase, family 2 n=1 Tax=Magnetococcus marinus (strain ATCC BAA-1437 / JCM 17883 / MC-1) TaxID=156889 RepID=A0LAF1_MAGMM|nr:glycosyltransferase family 2 protein [Magnetococcus marinus]ABK44944.1 glycosyl transferase, family 2 [Magnetococcus marinus MC-1]
MALTTVSVVIPVKNEADKLGACLQAILTQSHEVLEIIVIDSGSTDGTQDLAQRFAKVKLVQIEPAQFNHGATRNQAIAMTRGEFVLCTVGDAQAVDRFWIERLLAGFTDDAVVGVCGQQVVPHRADTNPVEWFRPQSIATSQRYQFVDADTFAAAPVEQRKAACSWDNVTALYRRQAIIETPFTTFPYGEDLLWAHAQLNMGRALVYQPSAQVYHYHLMNHQTTMKRTLVVLNLLYRVHGFVHAPYPWLLTTLRGWYTIWHRATGLTMRQRVFWSYSAVENNFSLYQSIKRFRKAVARGDGALDRLLQRYCGGAPPIPVK